MELTPVAMRDSKAVASTPAGPSERRSRARASASTCAAVCAIAATAAITNATACTDVKDLQLPEGVELVAFMLVRTVSGAPTRETIEHIGGLQRATEPLPAFDYDEGRLILFGYSREQIVTAGDPSVAVAAEPLKLVERCDPALPRAVWATSIARDGPPAPLEPRDLPSLGASWVEPHCPDLAPSRRELDSDCGQRSACSVTITHEGCDYTFENVCGMALDPVVRAHMASDGTFCRPEGEELDDCRLLSSELPGELSFDCPLNACAVELHTGADVACDGDDCSIARCAAGREDCNRQFADGCEAELSSDPANCGSCGEVCSSGACESGICKSWRLIAAFGMTTCGVDLDGILWCWGGLIQHDEGTQTSFPVSTASPRRMEMQSGARAIVNDCALTSGGDVYCGISSDQPYAISGVSLAFRLFVGCATNAADEVLCWGGSREATKIPGSRLASWANNHGPQCYSRGRGVYCSNTRSALPANVTLPENVTQVVGGTDAMCALLESGRIYCWGDGTSGQLGNGSEEPSGPTPVEGIDDARGIAWTPGTFCASSSRKGVLCWGQGAGGQLGPNVTHSAVPIVVDTAHATSISLGADHGCFLDGYEFARCWGSNSLGQLGLGIVPESLPPNEVDLPAHGAASLEITTSDSITCVVNGDELICWGTDRISSIFSNNQSPTTLASFTGMHGISISDRYATEEPGVGCGLAADDELICWGNHGFGALGAELSVSTPTPVHIDLPGVTKVSAGATVVCALDVRRQLFCWGTSFYGELDVDEEIVSQPVPARVPDNVTDVCVSKHVCIITTAGNVVCWGTQPFAVEGSEGATSLSCGIWTTCGIFAGGSVECWGIPLVEHGSDTPSVSAIVVEGVEGAIELALGGGHACALRADGAVYCWGSNTWGESGAPATSSITSPHRVEGLPPLRTIAAGGSTTCGITTDGRVICWGDGRHCQRGTCEPWLYHSPRVVPPPVSE